MITLLCIIIIQLNNGSTVPVIAEGRALETSGDFYTVDFGPYFKNRKYFLEDNISVRQVNGNLCLVKGN